MHSESERGVELLPCPFCGSEVTLVEREKLFFFRCPDSSPCIGSWIATSGHSEHQEAAIARWNTRATSPTTGWRSDMEAAPRDGTPVLLWAFNEDEFDDWDGSDEGRPERAAYTACMNFQGLWWLPNSLRQVRMPTHWMPLPPPPTTPPAGGET